MKPFSDPAVDARFRSYPPKVRAKMLALRELVFDTAARSPDVGELQETLKWGEPAYVTAKSKSGSTVRMDWKARAPHQYAMYFHCQSGLVETFRTLFPKEFRFEGNRALVFALDEKVPKDALAFCIDAALTLHSRKKASVRRAQGAA
ncbi:DUF1801 domain-containing protein [Hydrogenophaga flava]|uniref:DUF1801 domain-containing protein n=1 Tax=Hydrogenophaga flava TaxID=65657 RepID=UPI000824BFE2|nr:DUF1801 domain-containing protein [Hydrogenophaga flava]